MVAKGVDNFPIGCDNGWGSHLPAGHLSAVRRPLARCALDDLRAPVPTRGRFEQELAQPEVEEDDGFELINFEEEACVIALR